MSLVFENESLKNQFLFEVSRKFLVEQLKPLTIRLKEIKKKLMALESNQERKNDFVSILIHPQENQKPLAALYKEVQQEWDSLYNQISLLATFRETEQRVSTKNYKEWLEQNTRAMREELKSVQIHPVLKKFDEEKYLSFRKELQFIKEASHVSHVW